MAMPSKLILQKMMMLKIYKLREEKLRRSTELKMNFQTISNKCKDKLVVNLFKKIWKTRKIENNHLNALNSPKIVVFSIKTQNNPNKVSLFLITPLKANNLVINQKVHQFPAKNLKLKSIEITIIKKMSLLVIKLSTSMEMVLYKINTVLLSTNINKVNINKRYQKIILTIIDKKDR
jgi:hypothetical protein